MVMAEYNSRPRTPIKVGFYDIIRTIGRGNFAVVKLARHRITKTEVAIKIIDKLRLDQLNLKKIYREIQILKLLNHQHIIKLYQVMEFSSTIYLVCEYARNGELFDFITEQGHLPEEKARKMFWQVLTAVEYCHKNNVVHRDLKAENLLLDINNNIKLADFGFSNFFQSGSKLSTWCGSPPYAAPEVFEGKVYEGPQLDVWSLGVVLYVLVCGTFPFDGSNLATLKERVLGGRFRIPYWMSQDCENLVRRMLVTDPKKRLTISQIKKHKWMQAHCLNLTLTQTKSSPLLPRRGKSEYNEHVLKIMQGLGINQQKTLESLKLSAYDHLYAIYHLLADRLKMHRTSFPLETVSTYSTDRRRPSNVSDQAIAYMSSHTNTLNVYSEYKKKEVSCSPTRGNDLPIVPDAHFDDMSTGLPTVQRALPEPIRLSSPPLPQIKTTMYENDQSIITEDASLPQHENQMNMTSRCQASSPTEEIHLGNYNLQQRRHTLMVPNQSQIQMLYSRLGSDIDSSSQGLSPLNRNVKLSPSGEEMNTNQDSFGFHNQFEGQISGDEHMCSSNACDCQVGRGVNRGNMLMPFKHLPTQQRMTLDKTKLEARYSVGNRRRSGISPLVYRPVNSGPMRQEGDSKQDDTEYADRVALIMKQRQLDTSPVGFREGRRASDGLLLLGNNQLKEHLQKLARAKAVPEMTQEDSEESWETDSQSQNKNLLQVPKVDRTSSGERIVPLSPSGTSPSGSGANIYFQPYNNNQSLARRRSLQVQLLQNRANTAQQQSEPTEMCQPSINQQQPSIATAPIPFNPNLTVDQPTFSQNSESDLSCHWSSWKKVPSSTNFEGGTEARQQIPTGVANKVWQDKDQLFNMGSLSVASDESVPSKAAAAQQQRDSMGKPIRQQSLPITCTSTAHPFGSSPGHHQSMAQLLQQRRLQRRLKVASHQQQQQTSGYHLPLPELEQLRIDSTDALTQFHNMGNLATHGNAPFFEYEGSSQWGDNALRYGTIAHAEENLYCKNSSMTSLKEQFSIQEVFNYGNQQQYSDFKQLSPDPCYGGSPVHNMFSTGLPIIMADNFANSQTPWMYDPSTNSYQKPLDFSSQGMFASEPRTNSADKLDSAGNETMEFALY